MDTYDLVLVQGETYERTFRWFVDDVQQPLAGWTVRSQLRTLKRPYGAVVLELSDYMTIVGDDITLVVGADVTNDLLPKDFRSAVWDLALVRADDPSTGVVLVGGAAVLESSATDVDGVEGS